jgi:hypothetical protein
MPGDSTAPRTTAGASSPAEPSARTFAPNVARASPRGVTALGLLILGYAAIDLLAGAPRSPLVSALPAGVTVPRWTTRAAASVGLDRLGPVGLVVASILALGFTLFAFGVIAWEAWRQRIGLRVVLVGVLVSLSLSVAAPLLLSRDVYSYAAYGRTLSVHHANPYEVPPSAFPQDPFTPVVSREWLDTRSVYGPGFTLMSGAVTRVWSHSPADTILAFKILSAVGAFLAAAFAGGATRRARPGRETLAVVIVGLNPVVIVHSVGGGHNDALVAALLAVACLLGSAAVGHKEVSAVDGARRLRAGPLGGVALGTTVLIATAVSVKVVALLALIFWGWALARPLAPGARARVLAGHLGVAAAVTVAFAAPVFARWRTISALANLASRQGWASGARLVARGAEAIGRAVGSGSLGNAFGAAVYVAFLALFVFLAWCLLVQGTSMGLGHLWGSSLLLFALAAPYLLPWYALWFLPFLALMADERLAVVGLAAAGLLSLTGIPAEPGLDPGVWRDMMLGVHYAVAPIVLGLFALAARMVMRGGLRPAR